MDSGCISPSIDNPNILCGIPTLGDSRHCDYHHNLCHSDYLNYKKLCNLAETISICNTSELKTELETLSIEQLRELVKDIQKRYVIFSECYEKRQQYTEKCIFKKNQDIGHQRQIDIYRHYTLDCNNLLERLHKIIKRKLERIENETKALREITQDIETLNIEIKRKKKKKKKKESQEFVEPVLNNETLKDVYKLKGKLVLYDGKVVTGEFKDGIRDRYIRFTSPDYEYEGEFTNGLFNGKGKLINKNITYEGEFKDGQYEGSGILIDKTVGSVSKGNFKNNKLHGKAVMTLIDIKYDGEFKDGLREGMVL